MWDTISTVLLLILAIIMLPLVFTETKKSVTSTIDTITNDSKTLYNSISKRIKNKRTDAETVENEDSKDEASVVSVVEPVEETAEHIDIELMRQKLINEYVQDPKKINRLSDTELIQLYDFFEN